MIYLYGKVFDVNNTNIEAISFGLTKGELTSDNIIKGLEGENLNKKKLSHLSAAEVCLNLVEKKVIRNTEIRFTHFSYDDIIYYYKSNFNNVPIGSFENLTLQEINSAQPISQELQNFLFGGWNSRTALDI